ncbi:maleylacetoacetate isomerase [Phreatobacter stygius]|uniref:Maleylacetoacetate isomerase n=1 Tax=Phreatobacter stygius TaxID=1940610 RepID=A0A4D7B236_9HYPH|nr:maleylacetoacetate isomerase [Phreatobacter stygius]QCI64738.1 maleylacetoacetate isomerase [Phreatobacter stygius]
MVLHGYFRSSASYRVRIALNLKGLQAAQVAHHLRKGEQNAEAYLALNPQGLVPTLETDDGGLLTQSLAIIDWLEELRPSPPLLPSDPWRRVRAKAFALAIACDIHPVQNLKVLARLRRLGIAEAEVQAWAASVNRDGLTACAALLDGEPGPFCFGERPTLADICLVPQLANARRFGVAVEAFPRLIAIEQACAGLAAFRDAAPDRQPDAE